MTLLLEHALLKHAPQTLLDTWRWKTGAHAFLVAASTSGDLFFRERDGSIVWIDTGAGSMECIAETETDFHRKLHSTEFLGAEFCETEFCENILLCSIVEEFLLNAGPLPPEHCMGYKTLPVFGGDYRGANRVAMRCSEHFGFTGYVHQSIDTLPDGSTARFSITD